MNSLKKQLDDAYLLLEKETRYTLILQHEMDILLNGIKRLNHFFIDRKNNKDAEFV